MVEKKVVHSKTTEPMLSSYLNRRGVALGLPINGNFELTARCNFDCKMCYVHLQDGQSSLAQRELTADQWLSLASDARDAGMMFLLLTGGEPFLRQDFPQIYQELSKMGIMVSINSNASLYNEELRELFRRYPPARINVTLYGGTEETYLSLCGNASFHKVVNNLRSMREDGLSVRLNVSLTPYNVGDLERIDAISRELELQAKAAAYMYPPVRVTGEIGFNCARFKPEEAGQAIARWSKLRDSEEMFRQRVERIRAMEQKQTPSPSEPEGVMCRAGRSSFWVTWEGNMLPCGTMDIDPEYPFRDGFETAWSRVREKVAAIRLPAECTSCKMRSSCGVCAAVCKSETGAFDRLPAYLCTMTGAICQHTLELAQQKEMDK